MNRISVRFVFRSVLHFCLFLLLLLLRQSYHRHHQSTNIYYSDNDTLTLCPSLLLLPYNTTPYSLLTRVLSSFYKNTPIQASNTTSPPSTSASSNKHPQQHIDTLTTLPLPRSMSAATTSASRAGTLPSPSIPSPNSIVTSTNTSSLNTPTSAQHSYDDLDQKIADFRRNWTAGGGNLGPELLLNCVEYATFSPRSWGFKDRSSHEKSPTLGGANRNDWVVPPTPPALSGWAVGLQFNYVPG
ncbi:MAG: hypothetical protein JOS17DRAFT_214019 [Linnemannia elongata]|nr:MAG: hypothetical protein JOS17DRAFT_214019 [Linnemannia elongata]